MSIHFKKKIKISSMVEPQNRSEPWRVACYNIPVHLIKTENYNHENVKLRDDLRLSVVLELFNSYHT